MSRTTLAAPLALTALALLGCTTPLPPPSTAEDAGREGDVGGNVASDASGSSDGASVADAGTTRAPVTTVTLVETAGAASPGGVVTFGLVLPPGRATTSVLGEVDGAPVPTQVDVLRRHEDGSIRHAAVTIVAPPMEAHQELVLALFAAPLHTAPGHSVAEVIDGAADIVVTIVEGGVVHRASLELALARHAQRNLSGELVTELRTSMWPVTASGAAHPGLEVFFDVRYHGPGAARVSVTVENTSDDAPGERVYAVSIGDDAGNIFYRRGTLYHHHHSRWRHLVEDMAAPSIFVRHDLAQLTASGAVPRYDTTLVASPEAVRDLVARFDSSPHDVLETGLIEPYMQITGGRMDLGLLPTWSALALVAGDAALHEVTLAHGALAGTFPIHYRERATGRPIRIDDHPTLSLHPGASGAYRVGACAAGACPDPVRIYVDHDGDSVDDLPLEENLQADGSHQPSLAYLPYLLTADPYFMDELSFWVSFNFAAQNHAYRGGAAGLFADVGETRAQAWMLRTLAHAAFIAPDADPERAYFEATLENNLGEYTTRIGSNPVGWWGEVSNAPSGGRPDACMAAEVTHYTQPWQVDFFVLTLSHLIDLGFDQARPMRDWLADFTIARFTTPAAMPPLAGAPYHLASRTALGVLPDLAAMYAASIALGSACATRSFDSPSAFHYPAIARAALAAPARDGLASGMDAYAFVHANMPGGRAPFEADPTWAIVP